MPHVVCSAVWTERACVCLWGYLHDWLVILYSVECCKKNKQTKNTALNAVSTGLEIVRLTKPSAWRVIYSDVLTKRCY